MRIKYTRRDSVRAGTKRRVEAANIYDISFRKQNNLYFDAEEWIEFGNSIIEESKNRYYGGIELKDFDCDYFDVNDLSIHFLVYVDKDVYEFTIDAYPIKDKIRIEQRDEENGSTNGVVCDTIDDAIAHITNLFSDAAKFGKYLSVGSFQSADDTYEDEHRHDGKFELLSVYTDAMSSPPTEYDVISSYTNETKGKVYKNYSTALRYLKSWLAKGFKGTCKKSSDPYHRGMYTGTIPCVRQCGGRGDIVAYIDYNGNIIEC